jgi:hypothetical protein
VYSQFELIKIIIGEVNYNIFFVILGWLINSMSFMDLFRKSLPGCQSQPKCFAEDAMAYALASRA